MRLDIRLRRGFALVAIAAVALLVLGALPDGHAPARDAGTRAGAVLTPGEGVVVAAGSTVLRVDAASGRAPNRADFGPVAGSGALLGVVLLAWLLVSLPWSGSVLGARGRLPGRRSPPLALS